jgi:protein SCO1/2
MEKSNRKRSLKITSLIVIIAFILYIVVIGPQQEYYQANYVKIHGNYLIKPAEISAFELTDNHGKRFTNNNLKKRWTLLFFGFTHCAMVCPTTLTVLNQTYQLLQKKLPAKNRLQVVFVTVDPERDTVERLNEYVTAFNPNFIGVRTTIEKTNELEKQFHIVATKDENTINHSAEILLINPDAKIQAYFAYPAQSEQLASDIYSILTR